jgi:lipopolysaccharide/colanic/teichoic acid biosynthesis glycosyltransferase
MRNKKFFKYRAETVEERLAQPRASAVAGSLASSAMPSPTSTYPGFSPLREQERTNVPSDWPVRPREQGFYLKLRRAADIVVSLLALLVFGLMLPFIMVAIKLDSPGPVFYRQERIGINRRRRREGGLSGRDERKVLRPGRPFKILKLRTMRVDAEDGGPRWASVHDDRITRVGRFLRKTRLDEVPQFWNVLKGQMSLIGPRPERLCFIRQLEKEIPNYRERLLVLPGITGLAQVINGYDTDAASVRRKVELDRNYIRHCGPLTDARILLSTVKVVIKGEGAH